MNKKESWVSKTLKNEECITASTLVDSRYVIIGRGSYLQIIEISENGNFLKKFPDLKLFGKIVKIFHFMGVIGICFE